MWRREGIVKTDVSEERVAFIFRVKDIYARGEVLIRLLTVCSSVSPKRRFYTHTQHREPVTVPFSLNSL
jgi:hypothetical protein